MNENLTRINELEKRVREELSELDSLASIIESGDDEFVKNKLKYLQAELDYLNNQSKLLNEYVENKSAVSKSQYVSSDTIVREDIQTDTAIVSESISQPEAVAQEIITEVESEESRISLDESPVIEKEIVNDDDLLDISLQEENLILPRRYGREMPRSLKLSEQDRSMWLLPISPILLCLQEYGLEKISPFLPLLRLKRL